MPGIIPTLNVRQIGTMARNQISIVGLDSIMESLVLSMKVAMKQKSSFCIALLPRSQQPRLNIDAEYRI